MSDLLKLETKIQLNLDLADRTCCISKYNYNHKPLRCNCLAVLKDERRFCEAVAEFQVMFDELRPLERKKIVIEWMRTNPSLRK
jgi:hypothetical protein